LTLDFLLLDFLLLDFLLLDFLLLDSPRPGTQQQDLINNITHQSNTTPIKIYEQ